MRKSKTNHESIAARGSFPDKKSILTKSAFAAIFILFITFPQVSFKGAAAGLSLWAKSILPGLFPAAVISSCIMTMLGGEYKHSKAVYAYIFSAGVLCGYPLGAMLCSEFHKLDPENDSLCEKIDFTSSCIGRQYLYYIVCKDEISGIRNNESLIKELHDNVSLRKVSFHHTISPYLSYTHFCKQQRRLQKSAYLPIRIKTSIITSTI